MLSRTCQYAVRAVICVAYRSDANHRTDLEGLARELNIPRHFLGKIMQDLVRKKIIRSAKGPNGGFYLTDKEIKNPLIKIVEAVDGLGVFKECGLGFEECSEKNPCPVHSHMVKLRRGLQKLLEENSIGKVGKKVKNGDLFIVR